jgi:hypothetical protein
MAFCVDRSNIWVHDGSVRVHYGSVQIIYDNRQCVTYKLIHLWYPTWPSQCRFLLQCLRAKFTLLGSYTICGNKIHLRL